MMSALVTATSGAGDNMAEFACFLDFIAPRLRR
jgi:hypothetical protein